MEQDHRAIKRRVRTSQHFRSFWGAWRTIAGYEAIHMIRQGPGVLQCDGYEGWSGSSLYCRSVRRNGLNL
ncbi:MAG: DDE-type integrase/transposase/recombinase [Verrucomicrobia bacterium]|nr:DDE-type integrase/transposase/recombinase [Verrucomicrobiota bacterium]